MKKNPEVCFQDIGIKDYKETWDFQEELFNGIIKIKEYNRLQPPEIQKVTPNYLLFVEHPHVYTLGKSGSENNLLVTNSELKARNVSFYKIDRGGDITYHGPGQIVGYPLLDLESFPFGLNKYVYFLEESIIKTLKGYNITAGRLEGATGVWIDPENAERARKICAIGIRASRWVTMHGFAFNINTQLEYFKYINPCGLTGKKVTSLQKELECKINIEEVKTKLKANIEKIFGIKLTDRKLWHVT